MFFNDKILIFEIIVKIFNPFVLKIYLFIVTYNALLYLALIRPVLCIGAIVKANLNKVRKKKGTKCHWQR